MEGGIWAWVLAGLAVVHEQLCRGEMSPCDAQEMTADLQWGPVDIRVAGRGTPSMDPVSGGT